MQVYHVGLIGTRRVDVVEAETPAQACWNAGWEPAACEVIDITDSVRRLKACGDLQDWARPEGRLMLTWTCHICKKVRPDLSISVLTKPLKIGSVVAQQNIRYCNDDPECYRGAQEFSFYKESESEIAGG